MNQMRRRKKCTHIRITRLELAKLVGCSREMVVRILKDLQSKRLITLSGKTIMVLDDNQKKLLTTPQIIFDQKKV
jgi:CRP-like cAMP-binding protein